MLYIDVVVIDVTCIGFNGVSVEILVGDVVLTPVD